MEEADEEVMGKDNDNQTVESRGYLHEDFRLFHNTDTLGTEVGIHFHDFYKVTYVKYGAGRYMIDGRLYDIKAGDIILVGTGVPHQPLFAAGELYDRYTLYISSAMMMDFDIPECHIYELFSSESGNVIRPRDEETDKFAGMMKRIDAETSSSSYASYLAARLCVISFLIEAGRAREDSSLTVPLELSEDDSLLEVLRYVNENLCKDISISDIATHFDIDEQSMLDGFKNSFGCPMNEYITNRRLTKAREMILGGTAPADACYACGYASYTEFSGAYQEKYGSAPRLRTEENAEYDALSDFLPE